MADERTCQEWWIMNAESIAPCGVLCDLCIGFQRAKNRCVGCSNLGNKPYHCTVCRIKLCPEKNGDDTLLCSECSKFPCRRIKNLDKRYSTKYGESPVENLETIKEIGLMKFIQKEEEKWKCEGCGNLLSVHREFCVHCGSRNIYFPGKV